MSPEESEVSVSAGNSSPIVSLEVRSVRMRKGSCQKKKVVNKELSGVLSRSRVTKNWSLFPPRRGSSGIFPVVILESKSIFY